MLTRTNYHEWSLLMQMNLKGMRLRDAIESSKVERRQDRLALAAVIRGVPKELHAGIAAKKSAKEAWEAVKTMRLGADRVKEVNAQKLLREFETITFREGETVEDFAVRITDIATNLQALGDTSVDDTRVVKKFLRVISARYNQLAVAIEMFCDMKTLTIEELVGRLQAAEDRFEPTVDQVTDKAGRLLLTEEDWAAKKKHRLQSESSSSGGKNGAHSGDKGKAAARGDSGVKLTLMGTPRRKGWCKNCGIYGHWAKECKRSKKEKEQ